MKFHFFIWNFILCSFLLACASVENSAPCFDGWNTDESGASKVWYPSTEELVKLYRLLPADHEYVCSHIMPSGKIIIISSKEGLHYTEAVSEAGIYNVTDRGHIVAHK